MRLNILVYSSNLTNNTNFFLKARKKWKEDSGDRIFETGKQMNQWLLTHQKLRLLPTVKVLEAYQALLEKEEMGGLVKNLYEKQWELQTLPQPLQ